MNMSDEEDSLFVTEEYMEERRQQEEQKQVEEEQAKQRESQAQSEPEIKQEVEDEEDDPVIQEFPVYYADSLADKLHLYQYPTRSAQYPLVHALGMGILDARLKPKSRVVEVDVPLDTARFYDKEKGDRWHRLNHQTMSGVMKECHDGTNDQNYMIGVFKDGELHVTALNSVTQLRPQFKHIDKEIQTERELASAVNKKEEKPKETRGIHIAAALSGEAAPKHSGALAARKTADEEDFVNLEWYDRDCDETWQVGDDLIAKQRRELESITSIDDYCDELLKL